MARSIVQGIENTFVKGLFTEPNPLNFPEHSSSETFNCVFSLLGRVSRRPGLDVEPNAQRLQYNTKVTNEAFTEFLWTGVTGDGARSFLVQQIGSTLKIYNTSTSTDISANYTGREIGLNDPTLHKTTKNPALYPCSYAQGNGDLFVCNEACEPFYIHYDPVTNLFTTQAIHIQFRDFEGCISDISTTGRFGFDITGLIINAPAHYYNIINQGWYIGDALAQWDIARTDMPSNSDVVSLYRKDSTDAFDPATVGANDPGNTPAPKGHFILDLNTSDRALAFTNQEGIHGFGTPTLGDEQLNIIDSRPTTVAFFAGRVFYSGINAKKHNSLIYFTQVIEGQGQYGQCFQREDPTGEHFSDLLPSDGGVIRIPEIGKINRIFTFQSALVVIASNGIWIVSGSNRGPFLANDYVVSKISSIGSSSPLSIVDAAGVPMWWGEEGIYFIQYDANYNSFVVQSKTIGVIDTFLNDIPLANKKYIKGTYDTSNFIVYWTYNDIEGASPYVYNGALVYNTLSQAFYPWRTESTTPQIRGIIYVRDALHSLDPVVKLTITYSIDANSEFLSYAEARNPSYKDWTTTTGLSSEVNYTSYFITNYTLAGKMIYYFQPNYVFVFFEQQEDSSFRHQGIFDFTNTPDSGKWSSSSQLVSASPIDDRVVGVRRLKVRGKGRALQMKFSSTDGQPFTILGWSSWMTANASV